METSLYPRYRPINEDRAGKLYFMNGLTYIFYFMLVLGIMAKYSYRFWGNFPCGFFVKSIDIHKIYSIRRTTVISYPSPKY